jgi:hypothetical protein
MPKLIFLIYIYIVLFAAMPLLAQRNYQFITSKKVAYLKTRNANLEKALRKWNRADGEAFTYHYNTVDLNGDDKLDALVDVSNPNFCGSSGCPMLIFKGDGKNFELVTKMSVSHSPIFVSETKTKGWSDLLMEVYGGGAKPYFALLKFNGKTYPKNPTVNRQLSKKSRVKFVEYLSGIETSKTGFELK